MRQRSVALDATRGLLVLAMIAYHTQYVAVMFALVDVEFYSGFWWLFPRAIAAGFVTLAGWNLAAKKARGAGFGSFARRTGSLGLVALAISAATWPVLGRSFVFFGVIHLLALSSLVSYPLLGKPVATALAGLGAAIAGLALARPRFGCIWLAWLGLRPSSFYPADYLPLAPWFMFIALGALAHDVFGLIRASAQKRRPPEAPAPPTQAASRLAALPAARKVLAALAAVGRKSLIVYLVHLPLLYGLGWLVSKLVSR